MTTAEPTEVRLTDQLGQALEDAAYECLMAMAGVDTHDVSLRDNPKAWAAIEAFAAKVKAAERERWQGAVLAMRGRLLWIDQRADTSEVDALLLGPNAELRGRPARGGPAPTHC